MTDSVIDVNNKLELEHVIGFNGSVTRGLNVHPDREHLIYSLGCTVIIKNITTGKQCFLCGHTNSVSCVAVSKSGRYIASGQVTHMGFKADIIIWDYETRSLYCTLVLHKVKVQALAFSPNDKYLVSVGGEDDGSVVVWNIERKEAICGSPAQVMSAGNTFCITYANNSDDVFVTGGESTLRVWELDVQNRKIRPTDVNMGQLKRIIHCIQMAEDDRYFYCGTTTGDILGINAVSHLLQVVGPEKNKFSLGISSLAIIKAGKNEDAVNHIIVGSGDGRVGIVKDMSQKFKRVRDLKVEGAVTSIALRGSGHQFYVGTATSYMYRFSYPEYTHELLYTNHESEITDICFPYMSSELFVTSSAQEIRIWHLATSKELRRISVPNMTCKAIAISRDGKMIISGWNDGKMRAFYPESGKCMFVIEDAAKLGVTALALTSDCEYIISGGGSGEIRMWHIVKTTSMKGEVYITKLIHCMKEHKASITCIKMKSNNQECVSSSIDGTIIIWNLEKAKRINMIRANTLFKCVCYHPNECQIITGGTDRKIGYYETFDGSMIREVEGSKSGSINDLDISVDGESFVCGGDDRLIKAYKYNAGEITHVGIGHSSTITKVKIDPLGKYIISSSIDGAILCWRFPDALCNQA